MGWMGMKESIDYYIYTNVRNMVNREIYASCSIKVQEEVWRHLQHVVFSSVVTEVASRIRNSVDD